MIEVQKQFKITLSQTELVGLSNLLHQNLDRLNDLELKILYNEIKDTINPNYR
jgi:hypothetical protein